MAWLCVGAGDVAYDIEPRASLPEVQLDSPGVPDEPDGAVDDVLKHGFEPPALGVDLLRGNGFAPNDFLSEGAQQVECDHGAEQDDLVGAEKRCQEKVSGKGVSVDIRTFSLVDPDAFGKGVRKRCQCRHSNIFTC